MDQARVKRWGKSPPRRWQQWTARKTPPEARPNRGTMAWPAPFPGWSLEPGGDAWPRGMTVTPQGAQDPAYRPTPLFLLASPARCFVAGAVRPCESVGHQLYPGHPWPYFSRSFFALIHECGFIA